MKKYKTNPFKKGTLENTPNYIFKLQDTSKSILILVNSLYIQETYDLNIEALEKIFNKSKPTIIKALRELRKENIIAKAEEKSHYYIHPDAIIKGICIGGVCK